MIKISFNTIISSHLSLALAAMLFIPYNVNAAHFELSKASDIKLTNFSASDTIQTKGYYQSNGVGAANYIIWDLNDYRSEIGDQSWIADGYGDHYTLNGKVAVLQNLDEATLSQFGATATNDHTEMLKAMLSNAVEGSSIKPALRTINLSDAIDLNTGRNLGTHIDFDGATINLSSNQAGFVMGLPSSGISNANIIAENGYSGVAIDVIHQEIRVVKHKQISNITLSGESQTGTAIRLFAEQANEFVTFVQVSNVKCHHE